MPNFDDKWSLIDLPPKNHKDVAEYAAHLFDIAKQERDRLDKQKDWLANYALYRGKHSATPGQNTGYTPVNLYFANIERTVSNITARQPVGEVVDMDGIDDGAEQLLTTRLKKWWESTDQQRKTRTTARSMEIYGITTEKPYWDKAKHRPDVTITDPFQFFPAPGNWEDISTDPPFVCFAYLDFVDKIEEKYGVTGVAEDDAYQLLGIEREKYKTDNYDRVTQSIGNYEDTMYRVNREEGSDEAIQRCLVMEVWVRDTRKHTLKETMPVLDEDGLPALDDDGNPFVQELSQDIPVYPDSIRKITITKRTPKDSQSAQQSYMVLDDSVNPNINWKHDIELVKSTHPWGRFPVYIANSYKDLISIWGFAAAEQVGDLIGKINQIVSKLISYVINVMAPPLIVQKHCGISRNMIETSLQGAGRLVLMPTTPNARIEFLQIPNLPSTFFNVLDLIIRLFDRVYQIEDADRGEAPKGVIAASAIVALQERNQVLMQAKTNAIDSLAEQRTQWAIGLWQNFGVRLETVEVNEEPWPFVGTDYAGREFAYVVEAGSTTPRTTLQVQEMAQALYQLQAIDRRALLEAVNFPKWKEIIERMGETQLDAALQVLIDAGMPEEMAMQLRQELMLSQGGPGDVQKPGQTQTVQPGKPRQQPPQSVERGE